MTSRRSRLAQQRRAVGLTQEELAEALHVDRTTVHRWESGRSEPQPYMRPKLAKLLGVTRDELAALIRSAKTRPNAQAGSAERSESDRRPRPVGPLDALRKAVLGRSTGELSGDLDQAVAQAHLLYQRADYDGAARVMPPLLIRLDGQAIGRAAAARRAGGYVAAAKLATKLGDARQANAYGATIDTDRLPTALIGRRSQVHLDLSRAAADAHDDSLAALHLLEAERVAAQTVSRNANAQVLIGDLLTRERRNATPGLRALATRAGVADV